MRFSTLSLKPLSPVCLFSPLASFSHLTFTIGRAALEGTWEDDPSLGGQSESTFKRASSMIDMMPQSEEEMEAIRNAVVNREGLLLSVFDVLRRVPRRVLMVLKLNDLTRLVALLPDAVRPD